MSNIGYIGVNAAHWLRMRTSHTQILLVGGIKI